MASKRAGVSVASEEHQQRQRETALSGLFHGSVVLVGGRLIGRTAYFGTQVFLARALGPELFGVYTLGWTVLGLFTLVAPMGLGQSLIRFAEAHRHDSLASYRALISAVTGIAALTGLIWCAVMAASAGLLANTVFDDPAVLPVILLFALALFLRTLLFVLVAATRTTLRMRASALLEEIGVPALHLLLTLLLYSLGYRLLAPVAAYVVALALLVLLAFRHVTRMGPLAPWTLRWRGPAYRRVLGFGFTMMLVNGATTMSLWLDRFMLGMLADAKAVGVYQAAAQLPVIALLIVTALSASFGPHVAQLYSRGETEALGPLWRSVTRWGRHALWPPMVVLLILSSDVLRLVFGPVYAQSGAVLTILSAGQLPLVLLGPAGTLLVMTDWERVSVSLSAAALLVNLLLNLLLVPRFGAEGAALAVAVANGGSVMLAVFLVRRSLGLWPYVRSELWTLLFPGLATVLFCASTHLWLDTATWPGLLAASLGTLAAYWCSLLALGLEPDDRSILAAAIGRLRRLRACGTSSTKG